MPQHLTIQDIASTRNTGPAIDKNIHVAPTFSRVPVRRTNGLSYEQSVVTARPTGSFIDPGAGALLTASTYDHVTVRSKLYELPLEVYDNIIRARIKQENWSPEQALMQEEELGMKQAMIDVDSQFFKGSASAVTNAAKGYPGLEQLVDTTMTFGAGATSGSTNYSAYFVYEALEDGVHWVIPDGEEFTFSEWMLQYITTQGAKADGDLHKTKVWNNGLSGYIGVAAIQPQLVIARVRNINAENPLTDEISAMVKARFKREYKPTAVYMQDMVGFWLSQTRKAVNITTAADGSAVIASDLPAQTAGVPIVYTDSLTGSETALAAANTLTDTFIK